MRRCAVFLLAVFFATPALACEVSEPFAWTTSDDCSPAAQGMMERINGCLHWAGEEPTGKKRSAQIAKAMKDLKCDTLVCDYDLAPKPDHAMVAKYIDRHFTDEPEFRGTFPPKGCKKPVVKKKATTPAKPAKKEAAKNAAKPLPKTKAAVKTKPSAAKKSSPQPTTKPDKK